MKLSKRTYNYIEEELTNYKVNKKELEALELDIIEERGTSDGQPRGNQTSNPTEAKTEKLMTTRRLLKLHENVDAISSVYERLNDDYKRFFDLNYDKPTLFDKKGQITRICMEANISEREYYRRRDRIVYAVASELGVI